MNILLKVFVPSTVYVIPIKGRRLSETLFDKILRIKDTLILYIFLICFFCVLQKLTLSIITDDDCSKITSIVGISSILAKREVPFNNKIQNIVYIRYFMMVRFYNLIHKYM